MVSYSMVSYPAGWELMEEGSRGSVLYAICDGSMEVIVGGDLVTDIVAGQVRCDPFTHYIYIYKIILCVLCYVCVC